MKAGYLLFKALSDEMAQKTEAALEEEKENLRKKSEERNREHEEFRRNNPNNCSAA